MATQREFNFDEIPEGFQMLTEGTHTLEVTDFETEFKNDKDVDIFSVRSLNDGTEGRIYMYYTEKALWRYRDFLRALGVKTEGSKKINVEIAKGKKFVADITLKTAPGTDKEGNIVEKTFPDFKNFRQAE